MKPVEMMRFNTMTTALAVGNWAVANAQQSGWQNGQVNATMCYWEQPRAAVVRDTLYLDGGDIWWIPGLSNGEMGSITSDGNPLGLIYTLNFSKPFNTSQNISALFNTISKAPNGGAANNFGPNYYDGALLSNDNELFLYGGLLQQTDAFTPPHADDVTAYQAYQYGVDKPAFRPGFVNEQLPSGLTRYVTYGGAASAPSENKAWYFSGLRSPNWGPIYNGGINATLAATNVSNTLIQLDMSTQQEEKWTNTTLPDSVKGRANPELIWVPVGSQGILVALGGVVYPDFDNSAQISQNEGQSTATSPSFTSTIDVFDIASGKWYQQQAPGGPGQLTRGCAVVAPAQDYSSFNIYWYGGYDGIHSTSPFKDDVWTLSLPSFMWMKLSTGNASHARAGHKCVMPYPDQMFVVGGYTTMSGDSPTCIGNGILQVLNLTSGKWMTSYDPQTWNKYEVPEMIYLMIGGDGKGGATQKDPMPTGWDSKELSSVFATPYPTTKLTSYYPYGTDAASAGNKAGTGSSDSSSGGSSNVPGYLPPVLGIICGLALITAILVGIILYRRRKLMRPNGSSEAGTDDNGKRIRSWMRGQASSYGVGENKTVMTVTSTETPMTPDLEPVSLAPTPMSMAMMHHEMADTQVAELMDTSPRVELSDTGLTPVDVIQKHTHFAPGWRGRRPANGSSVAESSYFSSFSQTDHASNVSRSSDAVPQPGTQSQFSGSIRPDSPPLGQSHSPSPSPLPAHMQAVAAASGRGQSDVSGISERDRTHLRHISDTTVSSVDTNVNAHASASQGYQQIAPSVAAERYVPRQQQQQSQHAHPLRSHTPEALAAPANSPVSAFPDGGTLPLVSPPTPPTAGEADDYISARRFVSPAPMGPGSPLRRSVFYENEADLEGGHGPGPAR